MRSSTSDDDDDGGGDVAPSDDGAFAAGRCSCSIVAKNRRNINFSLFLEPLCLSKHLLDPTANKGARNAHSNKARKVVERLLQIALSPSLAPLARVARFFHQNQNCYFFLFLRALVLSQRHVPWHRTADERGWDRTDRMAFSIGKRREGKDVNSGLRGCNVVERKKEREKNDSEREEHNEEISCGSCPFSLVQRFSFPSFFHHVSTTTVPAAAELLHCDLRAALAQARDDAARTRRRRRRRRRRSRASFSVRGGGGDSLNRRLHRRRRRRR